jgi:hypothetical protein
MAGVQAGLQAPNYRLREVSIGILGEGLGVQKRRLARACGCGKGSRESSKGTIRHYSQRV